MVAIGIELLTLVENIETTEHRAHPTLLRYFERPSRFSDGRPLDPKERASPPFAPTLRNRPVEDGGTSIPLPPQGSAFSPEWRIYARGAGDDKAPIIAMLTALNAIRAAGLQAKSNIRLAFEGEEEAGSTNLEPTIAANKALFGAAVWLIL